MTEVEAALVRIVDAGGYRLPDTRTTVAGVNRLDRAAEWTWVRIRLTYPQIARRWEQHHAGDIRLQAPDAEARRWEAEHPGDGLKFDARYPVDQVGKAIADFAGRANVDVTTYPGRPSKRDEFDRL